MLRPTALFMKVVCLQESIQWTVPSFPVLNIDFTKALAVVRGVQKHVLFQREKSHKVRAEDKISCSKWCEIVINDLTYLVAWDFTNTHSVTTNLEIDVEDLGESEIEDEETLTEHMVPFKVLGIMFKNRQTYLMSASKKLASGHHVQVALKPEPDNEYDKNAIAVLLEYSCGWKVVGYIAREPTGYLHPLIHSNSIKVTIVHIRFRVNCFLLPYN